MEEKGRGDVIEKRAERRRREVISFVRKSQLNCEQARECERQRQTNSQTGRQTGRRWLNNNNNKTLTIIRAAVEHERDGMGKERAQRRWRG